jgi:hypothetical protein
MINISDNTKFGFKRKADDSKALIVIDQLNEYVILQVAVYNYTSSDELITDIPAAITILRADNTTWVNQQGVPVDEDSADKFMKEYDFFSMMMGMPVVVNDMITGKITWADSLNRFD